ncbi:MAG: hypothetical protein HYZ42_04980 [Bacteroidetes bacterium]|nr:hypothetical protein [Bacteroidota bacterium]
MVIEDLHYLKDNGTITLKIKVNNSIFIEVEFIQKSILNDSIQLTFPGSLLLNGKEVGIRSALENELLSMIKVAVFSSKILEAKKEQFKKLISDAINFVESEDYIKVAQQVGRMA